MDLECLGQTIGDGLQAARFDTDEGRKAEEATEDGLFNIQNLHLVGCQHAEEGGGDTGAVLTTHGDHCGAVSLTQRHLLTGLGGFVIDLETFSHDDHSLMIQRGKRH